MFLEIIFGIFIAKRNFVSKNQIRRQFSRGFRKFRKYYPNKDVD